MKKVLGIITLLVCAVLLVACAPANSEKAKAKMEKAGYNFEWSAYDEVQKNGAVGTFLAGSDKALGQAIGSIFGSGDDVEAMGGILFDSAKNAKAYYEDQKDAEGKTDYVLVGKWVVYGNEKLIKAFKK